MVDEFIQSESDSDGGLPPPLPVKKPIGLPSLKIGGLGLSTLAGDNGKTAEEMGDMQVLMDAKKKPAGNQSETSRSESDSDAGLPPPLPVKKPMALPNLNIGGLGLSTLAGDGGKTAEEMGDM